VGAAGKAAPRRHSGGSDGVAWNGICDAQGAASHQYSQAPGQNGMEYVIWIFPKISYAYEQTKGRPASAARCATGAATIPKGPRRLPCMPLTALLLIDDFLIGDIHT
jgi:hypothetical protein